jgi:hypothetical protein
MGIRGRMDGWHGDEDDRGFIKDDLETSYCEICDFEVENCECESKENDIYNCWKKYFYNLKK